MPRSLKAKLSAGESSPENKTKPPVARRSRASSKETAPAPQVTAPTQARMATERSRRIRDIASRSIREVACDLIRATGGQSAVKKISQSSSRVRTIGLAFMLLAFDA